MQNIFIYKHLIKL